MWLIVSSLSPHNLYLLFCCVLPILALIWLVLMALFYASIRSDSVSLLKFPFLSHIHVFSCEMLLVSRLKCPYGCFSSHFCFLTISVLLIHVLSVLFLVAIISLPPHFSMYSLSRCIDASALFSILANPLPLFLDTYSLSTSSLRCKALCMVFTPLIRFLLYGFASSSSLVLRRHSFKIFLSSQLVW